MRVTQSILSTEWILRQTGFNGSHTNFQQFRQNTERGTQRASEQERAVDPRILSLSPHSLCRWCADVSPGRIALSSVQNKEVVTYRISCNQDVLSSQCLLGHESCSQCSTSSLLCIVPVGKTNTLELEGHWKVLCPSFLSTSGLKQIYLNRKLRYNFQVWRQARYLKRG